MSEAPILYELEAGVATITLNRPQAYNAFTEQMHADLGRALGEAERDPTVRCVVLAGAGKAFCSGQDLKELPEDVDFGALVRERYNPLIMRLQALPKPTIAAVNGVAAGAGMSLALACDLRVAVAGARFVAAFVNIGLVPDSGMTYLLPRLIGPARAAELCMLGGTLDAATALGFGMVNQVAEPAEFAASVRALAERLARGPALALGLIKRGLALGSGNATLEQVLEFEAEAQQIAGSSPDYAEGVVAFRERRAPVFG